MSHTHSEEQRYFNLTYPHKAWWDSNQQSFCHEPAPGPISAPCSSFSITSWKSLTSWATLNSPQQHGWCYHGSENSDHVSEILVFGTRQKSERVRSNEHGAWGGRSKLHLATSATTTCAVWTCTWSWTNITPAWSFLLHFSLIATNICIVI